MGRSGGLNLRVEDWLESAVLARSVARVARLHGVSEAPDIEDVVQDVRIALWEKGLQQSVRAAWISRVARNKTIDLIRRRLRERLAMTSSIAAARTRSDSELVYLLHVRVSSLPAYLKRFYELHYVLALSERETGKRLGILRESVRSLDRSLRDLVR